MLDVCWLIDVLYGFEIGILVIFERWIEDGFDVMMVSNYFGFYILICEFFLLF